MPDMPFWVAKGRILMELDAADEATLVAIRRDLTDNLPIHEVAARNLTNLSPAAINHLRDDWFGNDGWFPVNPTQVIRETFIHAINVVNPGPKKVERPLDCYWICVQGDEDAQVTAMVSGRPGSVVVIIKTPFPTIEAAPAGGMERRDEPFRLVFAGREPFHPQYREI